MGVTRTVSWIGGAAGGPQDADRTAGGVGGVAGGHGGVGRAPGGVSGVGQRPGAVVRTAGGSSGVAVWPCWWSAPRVLLNTFPKSALFVLTSNSCF